MTDDIYISEDNPETTIYQDISAIYNSFIAAENDLKYYQLDDEEEYNSNNIVYGLLRLILYEIFIKKIFLELFYNIIILKSFIHIFFIITFIFHIFIPYFFTYPLYNRITSNI